MLQHSTNTNTSVVPSHTDYATNPTPATTRRQERRLRSTSSDAYSRDVALFIRFGGAIPAQPAAVLRYLELLRGKVAPSTAYRRAMAIQRVHVDGGHPSPTDDPAVRAAIRCLHDGRFPPKAGAKSAKPGVVPAKREPKSAKPMTRVLLQKVEEALGRNMLDRRDRAILLLGFTAALKRSALTALNVRDLSFTPDAMIVTVYESAAVDAVAGPGPRAGLSIAVPVTSGPLCAASAVRQYIEHLELTPEHALFTAFNRAGEPTSERLSAAFVSCIVKRRLSIIGVDAKDYSAESLCIGRRLELPKGVSR